MGIKKEDVIIQRAEDRGEKVSPVLPNANWISLSGNFTPQELRAIADKVEAQFNGSKTANGNPH
jgi:hypothetical protein